MAATIENLDSDKTFFNISINTGQICMGFEADTPKRMTAAYPLYATYGERSD